VLPFISVPLSLLFKALAGLRRATDPPVAAGKRKSFPMACVAPAQGVEARCPPRARMSHRPALFVFSLHIVDAFAAAPDVG
jgi:hypothetical protein